MYESIQDRSFRFAVEVVSFCLKLEKDFSLRNIIVKQLMRSGTSVCANAEEAKAGQSKADFIAKLSISHKEARETLYWLRLIKAANIVGGETLDNLIREADEIVKILNSSLWKAKDNQKRSGSYGRRRYYGNWGTR